MGAGTTSLSRHHDSSRFRPLMNAYASVVLNLGSEEQPRACAVVHRILNLLRLLNFALAKIFGYISTHLQDESYFSLDFHDHWGADIGPPCP